MTRMAKLRGQQNRVFRAKLSVRKEGQVYDLTNDTLTFAIFTKDKNIEVPGTRVTSNAGITQTIEGDATILLPAAVMSFPHGEYVFELLLNETSTGYPHTLMSGIFELVNTYI